MSFVGLRSGSAGEASWVQLGYGKFKLRHVMAGKVSSVEVRCVEVCCVMAGKLGYVNVW